MWPSLVSFSYNHPPTSLRKGLPIGDEWHLGVVDMEYSTVVGFPECSGSYVSLAAWFVELHNN